MNETDYEKKTDEELERSILQLRALIDKSKQTLEDLIRQKAERDSRNLIRLMCIKREDVQLRDGDGIPFFGHISQFGAWLKTIPAINRKRFCSWNGWIYLTSEVIDGRYQELALYSHVP